MRIFKRSAIKYKGKIFVIIETEMKGKLPGIRGGKNGVVRILLNTNLPKRKKQLEFHRLLTGRGLKYIENGKKVRKFA